LLNDRGDRTLKKVMVSEPIVFSGSTQRLTILKCFE